MSSRTDCISQIKPWWQGWRREQLCVQQKSFKQVVLGGTFKDPFRYMILDPEQKKQHFREGEITLSTSKCNCLIKPRKYEAASSSVEPEEVWSLKKSGEVCQDSYWSLGFQAQTASSFQVHVWITTEQSSVFQYCPYASPFRRQRVSQDYHSCA